MRLSKQNKFISLVVAVAALFYLGNVNVALAATNWTKTIDFGDAGYSETGVSWRTYTNPQSHNGTYRYLSHWGRGIKRVGTATWETEIPYSGTYRVTISYRQTENRTPDANYFVTNNAGEMDEFVVNQTGDLALIWKDLGVYHYRKGNTVKVFLDATDDNYSDCADAARWTLVEMDDPIVMPPVNSLLLKTAPVKR